MMNESRKVAPIVGEMFFKGDGARVLIDCKRNRFMVHEKVSRKVAKDKGFVYYWSGSVCKKCNEADYRYTSSGSCVACHNKKPTTESSKKAQQVRKSTQDLEMELKLKKLSEYSYDF